MRIVVVRWLLLPFFQMFRWSLVVLLWLATLAVFTLGLSSLARIFTGDAEYGALDGVQFTEALYQAVFRFIVVAVLVLLLQRLLRWRPGTWLKTWLERADADRRERRSREPGDAVVAVDGVAGTTGHVDGGSVGIVEPGDADAESHDVDGDDEHELVAARPKLKGRPRAWVVPD